MLKRAVSSTTNIGNVIPLAGTLCFSKWIILAGGINVSLSKMSSGSSDLKGISLLPTVCSVIISSYSIDTSRTNDLRVIIFSVIVSLGKFKVNVTGFTKVPNGRRGIKYISYG